MKKNKDKIYNSWQAMKRRCDDPKNKAYKYYGGKGIYVCDEWLHDETAFRKWSLSNGYKDGYSIDRIDNSKPYCPENCRWVDHKRQMNNFSRNVIIEYKNEKHTMAEWCDILGLNYNTVRGRLRQYGWNIDKAFETNKKCNQKLITYNGKTQNLRQWANELGINHYTLCQRLNRYRWSIERAFNTPLMKNQYTFK